LVNSELERIKERADRVCIRGWRAIGSQIRLSKPSVQAGVMIKELSKIELQLSENLMETEFSLKFGKGCGGWNSTQ